MNAIDAIRLMVKHHPGGVDALAAQCGKSPETLRKEIADAAGYKLGVADACVISEACIRASSPHCHAYANAVAVNCGGFVQLEVREMTPAANIHSEAASLMKECADVATTIAEGMADGSLSPNDIKRTDKELAELLEQIQRVQAAVMAQAARGPALRSA
jgi:hypothetical protein